MITQTPTPIGPMPCTVKLDDTGTSLALLVALLCVVAVNVMRRKAK